MSPCAGLPVPTPSSTRSPETYCSVLICFAAHATGRRASSMTPKPIFTRSVTAAAVARTTVLSRIGALAITWSVDQTESRPACSANRALSRTSPRTGRAGSGVEVGRITPISMLMLKLTTGPGVLFRPALTGRSSASRDRGVDLRVLAAADRAAPAQGDGSEGARAVRAGQHRDAEGVSRPDRRLAVPRRDPGDGRQPAVPDGEGPQVDGVAVGRAVGQPADLGDAGARARGLDDVDGVAAVRRDADRGGPGLAAVDGVGEPADVAVARGGLGVPGGVEVPGPVGAQVAVDPPFGVRGGARTGADHDRGRPGLAAVG